MYAHDKQEGGDHEGRQSETAFDEEPGQIGTHAATGVAELMMLVEELPFARRLNQRLVSGSRREIRDERQREITCQNEYEQAYEEIEALVLKKIAEADSLHEVR